MGTALSFFDMLGNTVPVVTMPASLLRQPTHAGRPVVRSQLVTA
jgi:hypothetical protein